MGSTNYSQSRTESKREALEELRAIRRELIGVSERLGALHHLIDDFAAVLLNNKFRYGKPFDRWSRKSDRWTRQ